MLLLQNYSPFPPILVFIGFLVGRNILGGEGAGGGMRVWVERKKYHILKILNNMFKGSFALVF